MYEENAMMPPEVLVVCIDYDGCTDTKEARSRLIRRIVDIALQNPNYKNIIITIGSLRQSVALDFSNAHMYYEADGSQYVSCAVLGTEFMGELNMAIHAAFVDKTGQPPLIEFNSQLTADVYNDLELGTPFSQFDASLYQSWRQTRGPVHLPVNDVFGFPISAMNDLDYRMWQVTRDPLASLTNKHTGEPIPLNDEWDYLRWRETRHPAEHSVLDREGKPVSLFEWKEAQSFGASTSVAFDDPSKLLMLYMFMHDAAMRLGPHKRFTFNFVDDKLAILKNTAQIFSLYPHLIPHTCTFQGLEMHSGESAPPHYYSTGIVQGTGKINSDYKMDMRHVANVVPNGGDPNTILQALLSCNQKITPIAPAFTMTSQQQALSSAMHSTFLRPIPKRPSNGTSYGNEHLDESLLGTSKKT